MKIQKATLSFLNLIGFIVLLSNAASASAGSSDKNNVPPAQAGVVYIDNSISAFPATAANDASILQLFSHGRPGQLLLDGKWRDAPEIVSFIQNRHLINGTTRQINIYGCEFGKGARGALAVRYIQNAMHINIAASNNLNISTSDLNANTSNLNVNTSNLNVSTSNLNVNTSNLNVSTSNLNVNTSNLNVSTSNLNVNTSNLNVSTSNLNVNTSNLNVSQITPNPNKINPLFPNPSFSVQNQKKGLIIPYLGQLSKMV